MGSQSDNKSRSGTRDHRGVFASAVSPETTSQRLAEADGLIETGCPDCHTFFAITPDILAAHDTRVRCGECFKIFDALIHARTRQHVVDRHTPNSTLSSSLSAAHQNNTVPPPRGVFTSHAHPEMDADAPIEPDPSATLDVTYADNDLFSEDAELPEVTWFDDDSAPVHDMPDDPEDHREQASLDADTDAMQGLSDMVWPADVPEVTTVQIAADASEVSVSDSLSPAPHQTPHQDALTNTVDVPSHHDFSQQLPFNDADAELITKPRHAAPRTAVLRRLGMRALLLFIPVVLALGLYGWRERASIIGNPDIRPFLARACDVMRCQLPPLTDLDAIRLVSRSVEPHSTLPDTLMINLVFVNQAEFSQPPPKLVFRFTNQTGSLVRQDEIPPVVYLRDRDVPMLLFSGERVELRLVMKDPGPAAASFELQFE